MTSFGLLKISFSLNGKCLAIEASGMYDHFKSLIDISRRIHEKVVEMQVKFLLLDFQQVALPMTWADCFNLVRLYEVSMPEFIHLTVAGIFNEKGMEFVKYWQEIARMRGYDIHIFPSREEAEKWLSEKVNESH